MDTLSSEAAVTVEVRTTADPPRDRRGFWALIATQFQGAFSDNILRNLLLSLIVGMNLAKSDRETFVSVVTFLFSLPFLILSMPGGWLADRFSKRQITIWTKAMEFGSMMLATAGLATHTLWLSLAALTLVASQAALFGPSKYGLLPELLPEKLLSWGNGVIELGTFIAIILGTVAGAWMGEHFSAREVYAGYVLLGLSVIGFVSSLAIDKVPPAAPEKPFRLNIVGDLWLQIGKMRRDRALFLAVLGNTYFWFLGSLLFSTIVVYGPDVLHIGQAKTGYLNATLALGIGIGSMAAGWVSDNKIEYGLIPLGSIGMTCTGLALGLTPRGLLASAVLLGLLGFWAGFFAVPVNALIQHRPAEEDKGGIIAAANLLSFVGIAISSAVYFVFTNYIHLDPRGVIVASSCITAAGTVYVLYLLPEWFARLILFFATRTVYRVRVLGRDNFPEKTGALLVCNHMSFVDVALLVAATDRPIRFLMYKGIYDHPVVKPLAKIVKAIPISSEQHPREMLHSLKVASDALRDDEIVCIFAEGQITRTGQLLPFRHGLERIMKGVEVPIIPVNLDGVWGSIFSFERGRFLWKLPRRIPYRVTVSFGKPMPPTSTAGRTAHCSTGVANHRVRDAQSSHEAVGPRLRAHGASAAVAIFHGGRQDAKGFVRIGSSQNRVYRTKIATAGRRTADDRIAAPAVRGWSADELCLDADGPRAREPELHVVERGDRELRAAVRHRRRDYREGIPGALPQHGDSRAHAAAGGCSGPAARQRKVGRVRIGMAHANGIYEARTRRASRKAGRS